MLHSVRRGSTSTNHSRWLKCAVSLALTLALVGCGEYDESVDPAAPTAPASPTDSTASADDLAKREEALSLFDFWYRCPSPDDCERREPTIRHDRSLVITDPTILKRFSFKRVMDQIVATGGDPTMTSRRLYTEWWDTQNSHETAVLDDPGVRHCDSEFDEEDDPSLNGYKAECPRPEGLLASTNPFDKYITNEEGERVLNPDSYMTIGLFNRMDVAAMDGSHCGEFRVVFAKRGGLVDVDPETGIEGGDRNLLIFEAVLPNPNPECGVNGCLPVARFWQLLSEIRSPHIRGALLDQFYFRGLGQFEPAIKADHFGPNGGHIRSNQFMQQFSRPPRDEGIGAVNSPQNGTFLDFSPWQLRDFKLTKSCERVRRRWGWFFWRYVEECDLGIEQVPVADNPQGELFANPMELPEHLQDDAYAFQDYLVTQVPNLAVPDLKRFFYVDNPAFAAAQSTAPITQCFAERQDAGPGFARASDHCYDAWFTGNADFGGTEDEIESFTRNEGLEARLRQAIDQLNLPSNTDSDPDNDLDPIDLVRRLDTLSCAGCHQNEQGVDLGQGVFMPFKAPGEDPTVGELPAPPPGPNVPFREWDFVHVSERVRDDNGHFALSPALESRYLPFREEVMRDFLCEGDQIHADAEPTVGAGGDSDSAARGGTQSTDDDGIDPRFETLGGPKRTH